MLIGDWILRLHEIAHRANLQGEDIGVQLRFPTEQAAEAFLFEIECAVQKDVVLPVQRDRTKPVNGSYVHVFETPIKIVVGSKF